MIDNILPNVTGSLLPVSGKKRGRAIKCDLARTLLLTGRCTYNASGTLAMRVNLYFSPDGNNFDTVPYTYFDITITAGADVQRSVIVDPPENGYLVPEVENLDTAYTITNFIVWTNVANYWEDIHKAMEANLKRG